MSKRSPAGSDPEKVLSQALRAMAGGPTGNRATDSEQAGVPDAPAPRFTVTQVLLIAAIVGVVAGMGVALALLAVG